MLRLTGMLIVCAGLSPLAVLVSVSVAVCDVSAARPIGLAVSVSVAGSPSSPTVPLPALEIVIWLVWAWSVPAAISGRLCGGVHLL
jgi:hypothetical protein